MTSNCSLFYKQKAAVDCSSSGEPIDESCSYITKGRKVSWFSSLLISTGCDLVQEREDWRWGINSLGPVVDISVMVSLHKLMMGGIILGAIH